MELSRFRVPFSVGRDRNLKVQPGTTQTNTSGDRNLKYKYLGIKEKLEQISSERNLGQEGELQICFVLALDLPLSDPGLKDEEWWVGGGAERQLFRHRSQCYLRLQTNTAAGHGEGQSMTLGMLMNHSYKELQGKSLHPWIDRV